MISFSASWVSYPNHVKWSDFWKVPDLTITNFDKLKWIYFFALSTKIIETLLSYSTFYAESNEHKIGLRMLKITDLLSLKFGFKSNTCQNMSKFNIWHLKIIIILEISVINYW